MLDMAYVKANVALVKENIIRRKAVADVDAILALDDQRTELIHEIDGLRSSLKAGSKQKPDEATIQSLRELGDRIQILESQLRDLEVQLQQATSFLPNMSSAAMPVGSGEEDNEELSVWIPGPGYVGTEYLGKNSDIKYRDQLPAATFEDGTVKAHHLDLGEHLGIIDMAQAAKVAGSRFAYLSGDIVRMQNALVQLLSQKLLSEGFMWMDVPLMVKERVLFGTSHFPEGRDQVYQVASDYLEEKEPLFLVGSSEPALFAFGMDKVFDYRNLPLKMFAVTPCFRSEVGSWGKDVRGIKRVHQFTKLEMDIITTPDNSADAFTALSAINEWLLQSLELPYRIIQKCTGDCGYLATHQQYDWELWLPSQQEFMEGGTDTHATDFQARRMNIRFVNEEGKREFAHTVNDTGFSMRLLIALMDNYQQIDGSIKIPDSLKPWMGGQEFIRPNTLVGVS